MKLKGFRELLVQKAENDPNLRSFAKHAGPEFLAEMVMESLQKMARNTNAGKRANNAVRMFAESMDTTPDYEGETPGMIRDAIGHHVSHYKAALNAGNQDLANKHARSAFKIMHMADKVEKHSPVMSNGKKTFNIDYVSPHAWEKHLPGRSERLENGKLKIEPKGLGYWSKSGAHQFKHLQHPPHKEATDLNKLEQKGHNRAYPFEDIKINGKHIHVDDSVDPGTDYTSHPFEHHPIMEHFHEPPTKRSEDRDKQYLEAVDKFHESPHVTNYYDKHEALQQQDPEAYAARGSKMSAPVHGATIPPPPPKEDKGVTPPPLPPKEDKGVTPPPAPEAMKQKTSAQDKHEKTEKAFKEGLAGPNRESTINTIKNLFPHYDYLLDEEDK